MTCLPQTPLSEDGLADDFKFLSTSNQELQSETTELDKWLVQGKLHWGKHVQVWIAEYQRKCQHVQIKFPCLLPTDIQRDLGLMI